MKRYPVSVARERLANLLDEAEAGKPVVIERRGIEYTIAAARPQSRRQRPKKLIVSADAAVLSGDWTWTWNDGAPVFDARRKR